MRAGHGHGVLEPHELGQHFRAAHHGNAVFKRIDDFRIVALDRRGGNHDRRAVHVLARMADHHLDAAIAQTFDDIALGDVRALHRVAQVMHDLGNAGHADAADADKVDRADISADALHR